MRIFGALCLAGLVAAVPANSNQAQSIDRSLLDKFMLQSQYAAAAYCNKNNLVFNQKISCPANNCPLVQSMDTKPLVGFQKVGSTSSSGFVTVDKTNKLIELSFRGSDSLANFKTDAKFSLAFTPEICFQCAVHEGFYASWKDDAPIILQVLKQALTDYPGFEITVTGHSLGGAVASIAAAYLRTARYNVTLYTFGAPRTGNFAFASYLEQSGRNFRVTQTNDPVPRLPPARFGYTHIYPEYHITTNTVPVPSWAIDIFASNIFDSKSDLGVVSKLNIQAHKIYFGRIAACRAGEYGDGWDPEISALTGQLRDPQDGGSPNAGQNGVPMQYGGPYPTDQNGTPVQLPDASLQDPNLPRIPGQPIGLPQIPGSPVIQDPNLPQIPGQKKGPGFFASLFNPDVYSIADGTGPVSGGAMPAVPGQEQALPPPPNIPFPNGNAQAQGSYVLQQLPPGQYYPPAYIQPPRA